MLDSGILSGGIMIIICSQCNSTYKMSDSIISSNKAVFTCRKCGRRIAIEPSSPPEVPENLEIDYSGTWRLFPKILFFR
jgi:DNA-directed RNA polymerase subunit RPC12/RpoP